MIKPIHPFPARMAPAVVWDRLHRARPGLTVLDPMSGSGTTPAMAQRLGHRAIGFDSDPLAVRIARAWCSRVEEFTFLEAASHVLNNAEHSFQDIMDLPVGADEETQAFVRFWFDRVARCQLSALATNIRAIEQEDVRDLLWCAFSRMIITKERGVSLAMDVSHSRPHRVFKVAPVLPFEFWPRVIEAVTRSRFTEPLPRRVLPDARIEQADARDLPLQDQSVDVVITSPPYLNAIDYLRGHRLSLVWMGYSIAELRCLRANNVGTERGEDLKDIRDHDRAREALAAIASLKTYAARNRRMITKYVLDLDQSVSEISRVLRPGGRAIYVVGDCNLRGRFVENSKLLRFLMSAHGLQWVSTRRRPIAANKRYLPPPSAQGAGDQLRARLGDEVILSFRKP